MLPNDERQALPDFPRHQKRNRRSDNYNSDDEADDPLVTATEEDDQPTPTRTAPPTPPPLNTTTTTTSTSTVTPTSTPPKRSIFDVPLPLKRIFDRFPLVTYEANTLPLRALARSRREGRGDGQQQQQQQHVLHVFGTEEAAWRGEPSYNPGCLKWQTYLKFSGLHFRLVPSNNHASPSGVLPFLQPAPPASATNGAGAVPDPVPANKLRKWMATQKKGITRESEEEEVADVRFEAYASLLDHRIRKAWLAQLYLTPENATLVHRLYVAPSSSHPLVQRALAGQLRAAAAAELVKAAGQTVVSARDLLLDARGAFDALATLLGEDEWFFGQVRPGLFDASVFAYSHLVLDQGLGWAANPLGEDLARHENLVRHRERVVEGWF